MKLNRRTIVAASVSAFLLVSGLVAPLSQASASTSSASTSSTPSGSVSASPAKQKKYAYTDGRYIVTLRDDPAATYDGGTKSLAATRSTAGHSLVADSAKVKKYASYLAAQQKDVAASVGATITSSYTLASNGFSGKLTGAQASALSRDARVRSIVKDEIVHVQEAQSSTEFLKLSGDTGVWQTLGGIAAAGAGVVIADVDTGIAPENPSFAGAPLGDQAGDEPYLDGDTIVYKKADGSTFHGTCVTGEQFTAADCSTKIIGARYFVDNFGLDSIKGAADGEYVSPRDGEGHGSHTASTAAGDNGVTAIVDGRDMGTISGVAPAAKLAIYKACWTGIDSDGCSTADLIAAIDAAVADNVDVINYSIGSGAAQTTISDTGRAFLGAAAAGIFVSAAAGNDGPLASTADNAAPWITTVAASTIPSYDATVVAGDGETFLGGSISLPTTGTVSGSLITARSAAASGVSSPNLCGPNTLDPAKATGMIVLCERGTVDRVAKSAEVARAGGIGMILVNRTPDSVDLDLHSVPTIHVDSDSYRALSAYAATTNPTVTFENGNTSNQPSPATPQIAGFSSRGPIDADGGDILKPDVAAPGVAILADGANAAGKPATFQFLSGTSMATPHVTGLAALYLGKRPNASPAEIKSAMMTTAYDTLDAAGDATEDPFAQGAGQVDPSSYFDPGMLYLNGMADWEAYIQGFGQLDYDVDPIDPTELNLASISIGSLAGTETVTRTVTSTRAGTFTAQPVVIPGVDVRVSPATLDFDAAGETAEYTVTFDRTDAALDEYSTGYLRWTGGGTTVTSPIAVRPVMLAASTDVLGAGNSGSASVPVLGGETAQVAVSTTGLVKGEVVKGVGTVGGHASYVVNVPDGTTLARFDLDTHDPAADFDLHIYHIDQFGGSYLTKEALTENADERIDIDNPDSGKYIVDVDFFEGIDDLGYTLSSYALGGSPSVGDFTTDPDSLDLTTGHTTPLTAKWSGLEPGSSYLGEVSYDGSDVHTFVTVTTDPLTDPLPATGELTVTTDPEWVRQDRGYAIFATGLVPGEQYDYYLDTSDEPLGSGFASDAGTVGRYGLIPDGLALGDHTITVRTHEGTASAVIIVSPIVVRQLFEIPDATFDGAPTVALDAIYAGYGTLQFRLEDVDTGKVYIDTTKDVTGNPILDGEEALTSTVQVDPGHLRGTVWAIVDGEKTQKTVTDITAADRDPSSLTITQDPDDADSIQLDAVNTTESSFLPIVRYKTCAGPVIFAMESFTERDESFKTYDLRGITDVTVTLAGKVIGTWENDRDSACADVSPTISQDFWLTMSDKGSTGEAGKPISATITNRYAAYSYGYDLKAGYGSTLFGNQFSFEGVPVDYVVTQGPLSSKDFHLEENQAFWFSAYYEAISPTKQLIGIRRVFTQPVALADLAPARSTGGTGDPTQQPTSPPIDQPTTPPASDPTASAAKFVVRAPSALVVRGSKITLSATGLAAGEKYTVLVAGKTVGHGTAGAAGKVTTSVAVPARTTVGDHTVQVRGASSTRSGKDTIAVIAASKTLTIRTSKAHTARSFTLKVFGLGAHEPVKVTYAGHRVSGRTARASASGSFVIRVKAGSAPGSKSITAVGQVAKRSGKAHVTVAR